MGEFLGEVGPIYGRWHWPFKVMKPGDWFIVDHAIRDPEEVRQLASVRASQLGIRVSVNKVCPEYPGFTKVSYPDITEEERKPIGRLLKFEQAAPKVMDWYGYDLSQLPAGELYHRKRARIATPQLREPSVERIMFDFPGSGRLGLLFDPAGFDVEVVGDNETIESWARGSLTLEDVMGS